MQRAANYSHIEKAMRLKELEGLLHPLKGFGAQTLSVTVLRGHHL